MNGVAAGLLEAEASRARQFASLIARWPGIGESATKANVLHLGDPRTACIYARRALDLVFQWIQRRDSRLEWFENHSLHGLVTACQQGGILSPELSRVARVIRQLGNDAIHGVRPIWQYDGLVAVRELTTFMRWFQDEYGTRVQEGLPARKTAGAQEVLPGVASNSPHCGLPPRQLAVRLVECAGDVLPVRKLWLERLLVEAGWQPFVAPFEKLSSTSDKPTTRSHYPLPAGDFLLSNWEHTPLELLLLQRSATGPRAAMEGLRWYAAELEQRRGVRPILCYATDDRVWIWDDVTGEPHAVGALPQPEELQRMIDRRTGQCPLSQLSLPVSSQFSEGLRNCVSDLASRLDQGGCRRLWVTPPPKVSRVAATTNLMQLLRRAKWIKRSLYLTASPARARRVASVMSVWSGDIPVVNLSYEPRRQGLNVVTDYATLTRFLKWRDQGRRRWGIRYFDFVVIDRASQVSRAACRAISDYFNAYQLIWLSRGTGPALGATGGRF
ncbi:MAG: DUF4145 domain-containing protein [Planctomycetota bacterium]